MTLARIGSLAQHNLTVQHTLGTQKRLYDHETMLASGKVAQSYGPIASKTHRLVSVENQLKRAEQFQANIDVADKRISLMSLSVEQIDTLTREFRTTLAAAVSGSKQHLETEIGLATQARHIRDQVVDLLNSRDDSRYLFSGGRIDNAPVDLGNGTYVAPTPPPLPATANTAYYEGDSTLQDVRADDNFTITYGITADNAGFEKVIRVLDTIANLTFTDPPTDPERQVMTDGVSLLNTALQEIKTMSVELALDAKAISEARTQHDQFIAFADSTISEIESIDTAEVVANLNAASIQLEASFTTIARVQRLSLVNFL